ncbi:hypothetical protein OK015_28800 (plasmid) [Mycobacterium sp. Aquia_216]|uniref:hypothetical protein n=1 Tax=Mycobacterium sp. Aquia_216 TaxID=2991729 RepID=UPI00227B589D|nr:hypothetical protein [Mycobacterium sp. Aquia_216]WAJ47953.1 hypothetical protein OK015_28800 [Mycobacterium sp. Aquia_216]
MSPRRPAASELGILVTTDEQMQVVPLADHLRADEIGANPIDTITARSNVVFWFNTTAQSAVNKMATLNLYAASGLSAHAVPLLRGTVLITGINPAGDPIGLSRQQLGLLQTGPAPGWWARFVLQSRAQRSHCRRPR